MNHTMVKKYRINILNQKLLIKKIRQKIKRIEKYNETLVMVEENEDIDILRKNNENAISRYKNHCKILWKKIYRLTNKLNILLPKKKKMVKRNKQLKGRIYDGKSKSKVRANIKKASNI